ncbi:MAG: TRAP transporter large permease subunit [Dehalococcoidales bacterium]|nr:TRAP transporter large permease subunit [Dehalococcoidales bacterium]
MSIEISTILLFGSLIVLMALGVPLAFAMSGVAIVSTIFLWGPSALYNIPLSTITMTKSIVLTAIPLFIFMGLILERSGVADGLYEMMHRWAGPLPGGLALGTVAICTIFAAMTGVSGAAVVTMGIIALPAMLKRGYDKTIAIGPIMAGGALGILIPPSTMMVIYAWLCNESVGRLFAAGVFPGIFCAALFGGYVLIRCALNPKLGPPQPPEERSTWKERFASLKSVALPLALIVLVLGSIFFGVATPTEAAAVGAFGAFICALINRKMSFKDFREAVTRTFSVSGFILWIAMGATFFVAVYTAIGAPELIIKLVSAMPVSPWFIIIGMQIILLIMGCFIDTTGIAMITVPVFVPIVRALGFDPIWFGTIFVINMEMAFLTPPFGLDLFYMKGIAPKDVSMGDIYRAALPFVVLQLFGMITVMALPQLALWLPNLMFGIAK